MICNLIKIHLVLLLTSGWLSCFLLIMESMIQFNQFISECKIPYTYELWYSEKYNTHNKLSIFVHSITRVRMKVKWWSVTDNYGNSYSQQSVIVPPSSLWFQGTPLLPSAVDLQWFGYNLNENTSLNNSFVCYFKQGNITGFYFT